VIIGGQGSDPCVPAIDLFVSARLAAAMAIRARDPARVGDDVADGLLSTEAARREYGVVITPDGAVDGEQTAHLRFENK
jgi:hypothetical protein